MYDNFDPVSEIHGSVLHVIFCEGLVILDPMLLERLSDWKIASVWGFRGLGV